MKLSIAFFPLFIISVLYSIPITAQWLTNDNNIYYTNGNVGIGTSKPESKLHVGDDIKIDFNKSLKSHTGMFQYEGRSAPVYGLQWGNDNTEQNFTLWASSYGGIKLFTQNSPRLIIRSNGNIGIGTETPRQRLEVNGNMTIPTGNFFLIGESSTTGNRLRFLHNGTDAFIDFYSDLRFRTASTGASDVVTFQNSGNVGIGVTNPETKLHVKGEIRIGLGDAISAYRETFTYNAMPMSTYGLKWQVEKTGTSPLLWLSSHGGIRFFTGGTQQMHITASGNVGIGTTNPESKLHVNGEIRLRLGESLSSHSATFSFNGFSMNTYGLKWQTEQSGESPRLWLSSYGGIRFFTGGNQKMYLTANGRLGIGVENPANALEVNGTIRAKEIKIETGWADFVFTPEYKLPSLMEVEEHISKHQHLPGIPTESEVKENGVNLGEMQVKLLQKIEELTLYIIQQDKEIKELKEMINK